MAKHELRNRFGGHPMNLKEKTITCFDCGKTFVFSVEEQEAFLSKGFSNAPKRTKDPPDQQWEL
jgi:hypothetical protein